jgi:putative glycosyltransferase (TIGR04372 family)
MAMTLLFGFRRQDVVIGIVRNDNLMPSNFIDDFERLKRAKLSGDFGRAKVILVTDRIPLSPLLWGDICGDSGVTAPRFPHIYRCMIPNKHITRLEVHHGMPPTRVRQLRALPAVVPKRHGVNPPARLKSFETGGFVAMQVARKAMQESMQVAAGRSRVPLLDGWPRVFFPELSTYERAAKLLEASGVRTVDMFSQVGDSSELFLGTCRRSGDAESERDAIQAWLFANCEVFVAGGSGAWWIAWALGRPTLFTDSTQIPFDNPFSAFLPVLLWDTHERRLLTLAELWGGRDPYRKSIQSLGRLQPRFNTAEEIAEATSELIHIHRGDRHINPAIQARVKQVQLSLFGSRSAEKYVPHIGEGFLQRHPDIL